MAVAALLTAAGAFLFDSPAMIWLALVIAPGAVAALLVPGGPHRRAATPKADARLRRSRHPAGEHEGGHGT